MRLFIFIIIVIMELMAYYDVLILMRLNSYVARTFHLLPYFGYTIFAYLIFGVFLSIIARWMQRQKKAVPIFLAAFNFLIILLQYRKIFNFSALIFILTGFYIMFAISKSKENRSVDHHKNE